MADERPQQATIRRVIGIVAALLLVASAVVLYRLAPTLRPSPPVAVTQADPTVVPRSAAAPTTVPTGAATPTPSGSGSPDGGGAAAGDIAIQAAPDANGTFRVTEKVRLSEAIRSVTVRPPQVSLLGGDFAQAKAVATRVQITADGDQLSVPGGKVSSSTSLALPHPAQHLTLSYELSGVTKISKPSKAGRALAAIGPLIGDVPQDLPVSIEVTGRSVRNLQCPNLPFAEQSCAAGSLPELRVDRALPWDAATIVVQLDLSKP